MVQEKKNKCNILIVAVGGAGGNAANNMVTNGLNDKVDVLVANTDAQALDNSLCKNQILLGAKSVTRGLGAGSDPLVGLRAAEESLDDFLKHLDGVDMVFFTSGMGGGTGTGATNVLAQAAKEMGKLVVAVVTTPFSFEGEQRKKAAEKGIEELKSNTDTLIIIPNQNLFKLAGVNTTFKEAFKKSDQVLYQTVKGITELITKPGLINLDFADVRSVMKDKGYAKVGFGNNIKIQDPNNPHGHKEFIGVEEMINIAMNHPLLSDNLDPNSAKAIMLHITVGNSLTLEEVDVIAKKVNSQIHNKDVHFLFGATFDDVMDEREIEIFVLTTGLTVIDESQKPINEIMNNSLKIDITTNDYQLQEEVLITESEIIHKNEEKIEKKRSWFGRFFGKKEKKIIKDDDDLFFLDDSE
jgi:cell division protein FtsZ